MTIRERDYHGYPYTEVAVGKSKAKVWAPSDLHRNFKIEFQHMSITDVPTKEDAIQKAEMYLTKYPAL